MDDLVVNNAYPLVCLFGLNVRVPDPLQKMVSKSMVIHRNTGRMEARTSFNASK